MKSANAPTTNNELKQMFALWDAESKDGKTAYYTGKSNDGKIRLVAFINSQKKNPKQPDIDIYEQPEKGKKAENQVASLWENTSKAGKRYLSGSTNENEKIIAFYNDDTQGGKYPSIRAYYKD